MFRTVLSFLYGGTPARFQSAFSLLESVDRLRAATERSVFGALLKQAAVGKVTEERVSLQRVTPFVGNSFKPYFVGRFEVTGERVSLVGHFTMHRFTKIFLTFWFGFVLLATLAVPPKPSDKWLPLLFGGGMLMAGVLLVLVGRWFSRNDVSWLSGRIANALSRDDAV
jgi:hypothetical protein